MTGEQATSLRTWLEHWLEKYYKPRSRTKIVPQCDALGFPWIEDDPALSKSEYLRERLRLAPDADLPRLAEALLDADTSAWPADRFGLEETLWAIAPKVEVNKKVRREVAHALRRAPLYVKAEAYLQLLRNLWPHTMRVVDFLDEGDSQILKSIEQHTVRNPEDWDAEQLFEHIGAFDVSHRRFCLLVEGLAGADVRPDETEQRHFAMVVNGALAPAAAELREVSSEDGYPVFRIVPRGGAVGRPKNLIFASPTKPDLRLRDAVSNDIEIVEGAANVLVYDRPVGREGLRWRDLQDWWEALTGATGPEAKRTLYERLRDSLPASSPPQRALFWHYYNVIRDRAQNLPALLPEVWLHWDPKTVRQRGAAALLAHRMDFLLLLPNDVRVVLEGSRSRRPASLHGRARPTVADGLCNDGSERPRSSPARLRGVSLRRDRASG